MFLSLMLHPRVLITQNSAPLREVLLLQDMAKQSNGEGQVKSKQKSLNHSIFGVLKNLIILSSVTGLIDLYIGTELGSSIQLNWWNKP